MTGQFDDRRMLNIDDAIAMLEWCATLGPRTTAQIQRECLLIASTTLSLEARVDRLLEEVVQADPTQARSGLERPLESALEGLRCAHDLLARAGRDLGEDSTVEDGSDEEEAV